MFQNQASGSYLLFEEDRRGRVTHIYTKIGEEGVLERVAWYETLAFQASILVLMVVVFAAGLVARLVDVVRREPFPRRNQGTALPSGERVLHGLAWLSSLICGLSLLFLAGLALTVSQSMAIRAPQVPSYMLGLLVIPLVAFPLALFSLVFVYLAWKNRCGSLLGRIYYSLVTLTGLTFVWFAWYWNLIGFKL